MNRIIKEKNKNRSVAAGIILLCSVMLFGCGQNKTAIFLDEEENTKTEQTSGESEIKEAGLTQTAGNDEIPEISPTEPIVPTEIFVDVCGAVVKPGVYEMEADSRVFQAIEAAGGMLPEASGNSVNQAQPVSDGQQIYVPTKEEIADGTVTLAAGNQQSGEAGVQETESGKVNLNTADAETLKTLSGIGDAKAQAILAWREENGRFSSVEDIMQVPGIKESTFVKIKDKVTLD